MGSTARVEYAHMAARVSNRVTHFASADAFRSWFARNHDRAHELMVGFYKKGSGRGGLTYREALDLALAYGWIDGVRKRIDEASYSIRFSPRKANSIWSAVNRRRVEQLIAAGAMQPPGLAAYRNRTTTKSGRYSYEQRPTVFEADDEKTFRANRKAWAFFEAQPPGYRRMAIWYVVSAVKEETRQRRLATLIQQCADGRRIGIVTGTTKKSSARN
jgi:uncharacterized protein YdeI (YjbR/CyaY-like superfamily)